jgi:hypothetical protein
MYGVVRNGGSAGLIRSEVVKRFAREGIAWSDAETQ